MIVLSLMTCYVELVELNMFKDKERCTLQQKSSQTSCSSSYICETCSHFKTGIEEHIKKEKSHIFKHLHSTATFFDSCNCLSFKIIDKAGSKFNLKIKEALHINWRKPTLNTAQSFSSHTFTLACVTPLFFSFFVFCLLFHLLFLLSLTLIISIFYSLNYTSLILHLIRAHLVNTFYNNYVTNTSPGQLL